MRDTPLENTGLTNFLERGKNLAIAHKLGGDNMGLIEDNRKVIEIILATGTIQSFSVSAFRSSAIDFNTTGHLIQAGESESIEEVIDYLSKVKNFHTELLEVILKHSDSKLRKRLIDYATYLFDEYKINVTKDINLENCTVANDYMVGVGEKVFSLLSVGEVIAAKVFVMYLQECGIPAVYLDTANLQNIGKTDVDARVGAFLQSELESLFSKNPNAIPIIPGYIGGIEGGILAKLGRGYTDYTGERAAVATYDTQKFDQVLLYIQKLYGFKSSDPRVVPKAKSVNKLSYNLTQRAISKKGAGAGLINEFALSRDIISRKIGILVGNPNDTSDIAIIDEFGNKQSNSVDLVLGKDYSDKDDWREYGRKGSNGGESNHNVYLMGEKIVNIGGVYATAKELLTEHNLQEIAGKTSNAGKAETSFVFGNKEDALKAQRILHKYFVEDKAA